MHKHADITLQQGKFLVVGDLNFANVMSVYQKSLSLLDNAQEWIFDFSQLHASDSSGLALIVEWIKHAKSANKKIQVLHLSHDLMSIAKAAGMDGILHAS